MVKILRENESNVFEITTDGVLERCNDKHIKKAVIPEGVRDIGDRAFCCCDLLDTVMFPSTLETISDSAFECCESLKEITIPENVKWIGVRAFGESGLRRINVIPTDVTICFAAFVDCPDVLVIYCDNTKIPVKEISDAFGYDYDDEDMEDETINLADVVRSHKEIEQEKRDIRAGLKPDSKIADENDFGF